MAEAGSTSTSGVSRARARVLAAVGASTGACTVDEVAAAIGITPATTRKHLDELVRLGAVEAQSERSGRPGRPRIRYRTAEAPGAGRPYERLAELLLEVVSTSEPPDSVGRRAGARHDVHDGEDGRSTLLRAMAKEGFEPELVEGPDDAAVMVFHRCPYASAALGHPGIVCALHRGFAEGLLGAGGEDVGPLEIHDPRRAGCRLHLGPAGRAAAGPG